MKLNFKPLSDQVLVITGASSGIGLATARAAAARGARVVLAARNQGALEDAAGGIRQQGGQALAVKADVSDRAQVQALADAAIAAFGGFDTWVNNAGVGIYGRLDVVPEVEQRRLFDVNYWGTVNGSLVAVAHLREQGGALINLGSILSDVTVPLQGAYCASKAAVRAFTDSLRTELAQAGAPMSVSLVKPGAIATPFPHHARNHMDRQPTLPPPIYAPSDAAAVILQAAERGGRDLYVGRAARAMSATYKVAPQLIDAPAALMGNAAQRMRRAPDNPAGNLFEPGYGGETDGESSYPVFRTGTPVRGRPAATAIAMLVLAGAASLFGRRG